MEEGGHVKPAYQIIGSIVNRSFLAFPLHHQALAAATPAARQYLLPVALGHPLQEAVLAHTPTPFEFPLHWGFEVLKAYRAPKGRSRTIRHHFRPLPQLPFICDPPYTSRMYTMERLASGIPVLTAPSPGVESAAVMVFAGAGSRYEREGDRGISHFLEHMFFKGGDKYKTTKDVSSAIEGVGGDFNAFTGKEYAGYYVKAAAKNLDLSCDVLGDMLLHAKFPQEEIEKERGVIMEEERMYQDTPMYRAGWDFEQLLYGNHPLGWDTIGTEKVIRSVMTKDFLRHKDALYTADNLVLAFAGKVDTVQSRELAERYFSGIGGKKKNGFAAFTTFGSDRVFLRTKKTEQAHLVLGVPGLSALNDDHFAHKLLAVILGGNMSSRMFLNIREAKGLCYYISTDVDSYLDAGSLSTRAGVDQSRLYEAITLIIREYDECAKHGITDEELTRAKDYLTGRITLSLEDTEELAHFLGKQQLLYPKVRDVPEYFQEIAKVTKAQVNALAKKLLTHDSLRLVVIGQEEKKDKLEALIA